MNEMVEMGVAPGAWTEVGPDRAALPDSLREALRDELEATREHVRALLNSTAVARWSQKSPSSAWTVGEVFVHLTWALEQLPGEVQQARRGKGMFNMPKWLADPGSYWYVRWLARRATPRSVMRRYDAAMDATLAALATVPDGDWQRGADFYAEGFHSVEDLFHGPAEHLAEHTAGL